MRKKLQHRISPQARAAATEWFVTFRDGDADSATQEAFYAWIRRSPENVEAYLRITALWEDTGLLEKSELFDRAALLQRAVQSANVVELESSSRHAPDDSRPRRFRGTAWRVAMAACALVIIAITLGWLQLERNIYTTATGEQRTVALQDGTAIVLNAKSRIRVRLTAKQRDVDLLEGQAIFRVAHDATRPFDVHSGLALVRAVGTQFDVYRKDGGTIVTVLEGAVAIGAPDIQDIPAGHAGTTAEREAKILVSAGEQITVSSHRTTVPKPIDVEAAAAWSQGKLVFNNTPLDEVVEEFNRYSSRRLIVDDPQLQGFHVSGIFPSSDPSRIAELLHKRFGVSVHQTDAEIRVSR